MGTGAEQKITITASSNLSEADIQKAVKEAEAYAAQDKKAKEQVEIKNEADAMVYQSEKLVKDMGDKLESGDKANVEAEIQKVKDAIASNDTDRMKSATEDLKQAFYKISEKIYQQNPGAQGAQGGPGPEGFGGGYNGGNGGNDGGNGGNGGSGPDVYEGDYKVVDDK
jgi:molecular chaperone DnaK